MTTLESVIAAEDALLQEASLALPHEFTKCTYDLGYIRQPVHLCLTCSSPHGICSACSIACHGDHEQVELFPKRSFRCDCPTTSLELPCTLHHPVVPNNENVYGQNFQAKFCRCGRNYDAKTERETMVQCVSCEDWFHESCLNLRERPPPEPETIPEKAEEPAEGDASSDGEDDSLPLALLPESAYDSLICGSCVLRHPTLTRWAGTPGVRMVVWKPEDDKGIGEGKWVILGEDATGIPVGSTSAEDSEVDVVSTPPNESDERTDAGKRRRPSSPDQDPRGGNPPVKRHKTDDTAVECKAPPPNPIAQKLLGILRNSLPSSLSNASTTNSTQTIPSPKVKDTGAGDIFLSEGWREWWCRCPNVRCRINRTCSNAHLYRSSASPTYYKRHTFWKRRRLTCIPRTPTQVNLSLPIFGIILNTGLFSAIGLSLEELGMRALQNLPRDKALDGIRLYNQMRCVGFPPVSWVPCSNARVHRDDLVQYLRPFATEGRVVREEDVRGFFKSRGIAPPQ
jgi:E3 ubiquitin-protein ligase UBR7